YPNRSDKYRMAIAMYLHDNDARCQVYQNRGKQILHVLDNMCRKLPNGHPDYSDPAIFPTLWCE
ncbi:MAG: phytanoyl-CoA dioxygenase, partial [Rivularia sp. (in: cyanobacteria)]